MKEKIKKWLKRNMPALTDSLKILRSQLQNLIPYRLRKYNNYGFHNDQILMGLVSEILKLLPVSAFIETGTYKGDTALYMANLKVDLPILTCEISDKLFKESRWRLRKFKNVRIFKSSSPDFLKKILKETKLCELPLFFLDAHADEYYWPLLDEVRIISQEFKKAVFIIDDFKVPGRKDFNYDFWEANGKKTPYNLETIRLHFNNPSRYIILYPSYTDKDAFPYKEDILHDPLRGYVVIFQDLRDEFKTVRNASLVRNHYQILE